MVTQVFNLSHRPRPNPHYLALAVAWDAFDSLAERLRAAGAMMDEPYENHPIGDV